MPEILVNGVSLYYEEIGGGAAIVGVHGAGSSSAFWADAARELGTRGRAIVYDRRAHYRSERPDPYLTDVSQHADDLAALIDALGAVPAIVIGRSYGADIAADLALRYPDRVRALALLEGLELVSEAGREWAADLIERVLDTAGRNESAVAEVTLRGVLGDAGWEELPNPVQEMFTANSPAIAGELRGGLLDVSGDQLGAISCPTLIVAAEDSPPVFREVADVLAASIPGAGLARVEGGHLISPAHPVVLAFVDDVLART